MLPTNSIAGSTSRIFIDASYTLGSGRNSGIERVVRNLSAQCQQLHVDGLLDEYSQIISGDGKFVAIESHHCQRLESFGAEKHNVLQRQSKLYRSLATAACTLIPARGLRKWLLPQPGHLGIFKLPYNLRGRQLDRRIASEGRPVTPRDGDLFLLPDAYWVNTLESTVWPAAQRARAAGAKVVSIIYDLIPLTHPQFVGGERSSAFKTYLTNCARNSDLMLTISKTVAEDLTQFIESENDPSFCSAIKPLELGCELTNCDGTIREPVKRAFAGRSPYLTISAFDPRKNHEYLLDAFDSMWQRGSDVDLVLVGRLGSRCKSTVNRVLSHPELGRKLHLFSDLDDAELQYCYRNAGGVVFPSIVEGFGLPIVEALWFGQKTFASDTKIHREVGQNDCTYFGLDDPQHLVAQIEQWEQAKAAGARPPASGRRLTSWRQCTEQVLDFCGLLLNQPQENRTAA